MKAIHGRVSNRSDDGFEQARLGHNTALLHTPDYIVEPVDVDDVVAVVRIARDHGLRVQALSSGHGPTMLIDGGILLRLAALDDIEIDTSRQTVRVGAGTTWGTLVTACAEHGLVPLGMASVASVGVGGYLLGGGMGPLGRHGGFGADHVVAVEMVDADGNIRTVTADTDAELFWALRGGKPTPGIVTAFTMDLTPSPELFAATLTYASDDAPDALEAYAAWQLELADVTSSVATMFCFPDITNVPPQLRGARFLQIDMVHIGDEAAGRPPLEKLTTGRAPTSVDARVTDPASWLRAQPPIPPSPTWQRGVLLTELTPETAADVVAAAGPDSGVPWQSVEIRPLGGALGRPPVVANAVGGRSDGVILSVVARTPHDPGDVPLAHTALIERLERWIRPGLNVNFHGRVGSDHPLRNAWSAEMFDRLTAVRAENDPSGIFALPIA